MGFYAQALGYSIATCEEMILERVTHAKQVQKVAEEGQALVEQE